MEYGMMFAVRAMRFQSSLGTASRAIQAVVRGVVLLFVLACCVLRAEEAVRTASPSPEVAKVANVAKGSAPASLKWTASDFVALGLMVLGATVVFIPVPKLRSKKLEKKPSEAPVREACRTAPHGSRPALGTDRSTVQQASTV